MKKSELTQQHIREINQKIDESVSEFIRNIPKLIQTRLEQKVAECLGFRVDEWRGGWQVDNCNGRASSVSSYIAKKAHRTISKIVEQIGDEFDPTDEMRKAIQEELKDQLSRWKMREKVQGLIENKLNVALDQVMDEINVSKIDLIRPTISKVSDPDYGKTKVEETMLEDLVGDELDDSGN